MNGKTASKFNWILDVDAVEKMLRQLQVREDIIDYVKSAALQVAQAADATEFFEFCNTWQEHAENRTAADYPEHWQLLAVIASFPEGIEKHSQRGVPWEITRATLADIQRDARGHYAPGHSWKFHRILWMRKHINGRFFEIGRLQYVLGKFGYKFHVYRHSETGEIISFALPGCKCTRDGWICEDAAVFETILEENNDYIAGHPALKNGAISATVQKIPRASKVLLDADSTVAIIHIPTGGKLDRATCCQSLHDAKIFFEKYFPEINIRAFCTGTWILDPEVAKILPNSNIADFGQLFHLMTRTNADDTQIRERVFGVTEWEQCEATNSLQKAILKHHQNGGEFRDTAGFILPEEIDQWKF